MKVLVLHSLPPLDLAGRSPFEFDLDEAARDIAAVLPGSSVVGVRGEIAEIIEVVSAHRPDVVVNACEAPLGRADLEAHVAAVLEWLGLRFTGCGSETLALCRRKDRTKAVLSAAGVRVPRTDAMPCVVKPVDEDGSVHIFRDSVCDDAAAVARAVARLPGPALIEEFIPGREFLVGLWGRDQPEHMSYAETQFLNGLRLSSYPGKWEEGSRDYLDSPYFYGTIGPELQSRIFAVAAIAWQAVGARGYLTVDVRLDAAGEPVVLEVNPNPNLGPGVGIARAAEEIGWTWERFMRQQVEWA
jgi:D-alanine-D-alanine ligase